MICSTRVNNIKNIRLISFGNAGTSKSDTILRYIIDIGPDLKTFLINNMVSVFMHQGTLIGRDDTGRVHRPIFYQPYTNLKIEK